MSSPLEGKFLKNRYGVKRHIATGGMAAVFLGWDYRIERPVAIKVLRQLEDATPHDIARFQREAQAAAMLNHPHVVQVFDFFEEHGCYFLVMEYVEGANLKSHLRARGALPATEALALGEQVCAALEAAHAGGFIHRDIKPQNVLLDRAGLAKLTDFGIVQALREARTTTTGAVLGTADYIAPEQARGEVLTPTCDLYALGVVLYELLTGRLPFIGRTPLLVATQHATAPVVPPSRYVPGLSPYVEAVVMRALRKQPDQRYQSAARMRLALRLAREAAARETGTPPASEEAVEAPSLAEEGGQSGGVDGIAALAAAETVEGPPRGSGHGGLAPAGTSATKTAHTPIATPAVERRESGEMARVPEDTGARMRVALLDLPAAPREADDVAVMLVEDDDGVGVAAPGSFTPSWRRLGITCLAAMALLALILLLGFWLRLPLALGRTLP